MQVISVELRARNSHHKSCDFSHERIFNFLTIYQHRIKAPIFRSLNYVDLGCKTDLIQRKILT